MRTENKTVEISGRLTNDAWGGKSSYGDGDCKFIHDDEDNETHDINEILNEFSGQKVIIRITQA